MTIRKVDSQRPTPAHVGPLSLKSREAQVAVKATVDYLNKGSSHRLATKPPDAANAFAPRGVEQDELGMTHVRMDRVHEGVKVFGEQVISHLGRDGDVASLTGDVSTLPAGLGTDPVKLTADQALAIGQTEFNNKTTEPPHAERVIFKDNDGQYKAAYRVELTNLTGGPKPLRMNYMVDANSGQVLDRWNQMGGMELPLQKAAESVTVKGAATPNAPINDYSTTTSTITIDQDVDIQKVTVNLDIPHTYRGDLVVSLTSPSAKTAVIHNRTGGSTDNVRGKFNLSAFTGESSQGDWKLTVEDKAKRDTGTLKAWDIEITGTPKTSPSPSPPPPPPPPSSGADDQSLYSGKVDLSTTRNADGTYSLNDTSRGSGVETLDARNKSNATGAVPFSDANNVWGEASDNPRTKAAVDAHYGAQVTYDFIKNVLGRDSLDGQGEKLVSNVHISNNYVNAYWDGKQMNYGDGDGSSAGPLTTLDIAGHEIAHGLTERTAGLIYRGESGGLNEAMSDIIGTGVEWYASQQNSAVKFDWAVGEDAWTPNNGDPTDALRYMDDPTRDQYSIDHYSNYPRQTEVHGSSGIANNAFYLLSNGGTNRTSKVTVENGVGVEKGLKIYGRALMHYMTPSTTFAQAREATVQAATDLYGADSVEVQKVKESWHAVGVG